MILSIDNVEPGMEVSRDVTNQNGGVLLPKGTRLTPQHLGILRRCEISQVDIAGPENEASLLTASGPVAPELIQAAQDRVQERLKHVPRATPNLDLIQTRAVKRRLTQLIQDTQ